MNITEIRIEELEVRYHPRGEPGDIESLQQSIRRDGLQEPLLVYRADDGKFVLVDGVRRLAAIQQMGWEGLPCIVQDAIHEADAAHLSYVKNAERKEFNSIEIANHLKAMIEQFGFSRRDLELKGYGSVAHISNTIRLLDLPDKVRSQIAGGEISAAHGLHLLKLNTSKEQERMAKRITDNEMSARKTEYQIEQYLKKNNGKQKAKKECMPEGDIPGVYIKDSRDMSEVPDKSVHLIVSSPPYQIGMEYEVGVSFDEHIDMVKGVLKECARVLTNGGVMALNVGDIRSFKGPKGKNKNPERKLMGGFYQAELRKHNIFLTDQIIWRKPIKWKVDQGHLRFDEDTKHCSYHIMLNWEPVYLFRKAGEREEVSSEVELNSRLTKEEFLNLVQGVWDIMPVKVSDGHPTPYPDELPARLIKMFSYEGDTVLDPWLGSGTTVKVARELNRVGLGYEREPKYKEVIMRKLGMRVEAPEESAVEHFASEVTDVLDASPVDPPPEEREEVELELIQEPAHAAAAFEQAGL